MGRRSTVARSGVTWNESSLSATVTSRIVSDAHLVQERAPSCVERTLDIAEASKWRTDSGSAFRAE